MLKVEIKKEKCMTEIHGTLINLSTETIIAINGIYESIKAKDTEAGEIFKKLMINNIEIAFMEDDEMKEKIGKIEPSKMKLIEALKSFLEDLEEE